MSAQLDRGVHITSGTGIVARIGSFVAYASGEPEGLNQLIVRLNSLADAPWPEIVRTITADIASAGYSGHPMLACATIEAERVRALVFGDLQLLVDTDSARHVLDGGESSTWIDVAVRGSTNQLQCGERSETAVTGVLRDGVVPAGGFLFDAHSPIPASVAWDELHDAGTADELGEEESVVETTHDAPDAVTDERAESEEEKADLRSLHELVKSIDRGDDPGTALERHSEANYVLTGERPTLGTLTFDDGAALELTRPVVIGRGVPERYAIDGEAATTVLLDDTQGLISNVHLEIRLNGPTVELIDKNSTSGTFLHAVDSDDRVQLEPEAPTPIAPDTLVEIGQRSFTFTVHD